MSGPGLWAVDRPPSRVFLFGEAVGLRDGGWVGDELRAAIVSSRSCGGSRPRRGLPPARCWRSARSPPSRCPGGSPGLSSPGSGEVARDVGIDPATLEDLRPWVAGQLLDGRAVPAAGYDHAHSVEAVVTGLAAAAGLSVRYELGDAEATLSWFDGLTLSSTSTTCCGPWNGSPRVMARSTVTSRRGSGVTSL